jgi:hypothetical protein
VRGNAVLASALARGPDSGAAACCETLGQSAQMQLEIFMTQSTTNGEAISTDVYNPTASPSLNRYLCELLERVRRELPEVARQLKGIGVASVEVNYDGCGDSGQIEGIVFYDADGEEVNLTGQLTITVEHMTQLFYDLLETRHGGWENNEGACGEFAWNVVTDTLQHAHAERFVEFISTEHEGL